LWSFNRYVIGYREKLKRDQADIVKLAYQTAAFTNSKQRPRPLAYYLGKILNSDKKSKQKALKDIEWAKEMDKKVEEALKRMEEKNHAG
jgi:hypothetical protein